MRAFGGFSVLATPPTDLYDAMRLNHEGLLLADVLLQRLGDRVRKKELHSGWDDRAGRDYFFFNYMIWTQRKEPSFIGMFHYAKPEDERGTRFQVWRREHDDEPVYSISLEELYTEVQEANSQGLLGDVLDEMAEQIRLALGLR